MLLADEINRTPPKTQAALLEAMEERQVTIDGAAAEPLPDPFFVVATQNPVEYEGTYPLPEAQLDRFLIKIRVRLPGGATRSWRCCAATAAGLDGHDLAAAGVRPVAGPADLAAPARRRRGARWPPEVRPTSSTSSAPAGSAAAAAGCLAPRRGGAAGRGPGPGLAARRRLAVARRRQGGWRRPVLRHRLVLRPEAELEGASADAVLEGILATVPTPRVNARA